MDGNIDEPDFVAGWPADEGLYPVTVRTGTLFVSLRAAAASVSFSLLIVAVDGFRRPKSSDGRMRFVFVSGLGLVLIAPLHVAEAGRRGGGISPCFGGCGADPSGCWEPFRVCWLCEG